MPTLASSQARCALTGTSSSPLDDYATRDSRGDPQNPALSEGH
jgi:hypothetical protein